MKLHTLLQKLIIYKLHFSRQSFTGNSTEYETIKTLIAREFHKSNFRFLFIKSKITLLTDPKEIQHVLKDFRDSPMGGHQGVRKMAKKIGQQFKWLGLRKDVQNHVNNCKVCQLTKPHGIKKQLCCGASQG